MNLSSSYPSHNDGLSDVDRNIGYNRDPKSDKNYQASSQKFKQ